MVRHPHQKTKFSAFNSTATTGQRTHGGVHFSTNHSVASQHLQDCHRYLVTLVDDKHGEERLKRLHLADLFVDFNMRSLDIISFSHRSPYEIRNRHTHSN